MSGPNSPTSGADKTFRFISDPGHKENLSGRVRAACLTCRRKKIKCSGELNCRTCREKGLVCEGLPERKRPRRDSSHAVMPSPAPANTKKRKSGSVDTVVTKISKLKQQTASPRPQEAPGDEDSGYASTQAETLETILSPSLNPPTLPSVNVKITYKQVQPAARVFHVDSWQLDGERPRSEPAERRIIPETSMPRDPADRAQGMSQGSLGGIHPSARWSNGQERGFLWQEPTRGQALRPDSTSQLPAMPTHDTASRRQSIAFPLPAHDSTFEQQRDPFAGGGGAYDDIATLLYARMGMGADTNAFHGLWDVNTDIAGLLAQQVPYAQTQGPRPPHPETNPQSLNDVFGHWPNWPNE